MTSDTKKAPCEGRVWDGRFGYHPCRLAGKVERDGKLYCGTHDPERVAARNAARTAKYQAKEKTDQQRRDQALALIARLGAGAPDFSTFNRRYSGGVTLSAEEAGRIAMELEIYRGQDNT